MKKIKTDVPKRTRIEIAREIARLESELKEIPIPYKAGDKILAVLTVNAIDDMDSEGFIIDAGISASNNIWLKETDVVGLASDVSA